MKNPPLVSIVIPVTKCAYLTMALESVRSQTYPNLQIVVIDNGSDGDVKAILETYKLPVHIFLKRPKQLSAMSNWNDCVTRSSGQYVLILSDDDILPSGAIESLVCRIEQSGAALVAGPIAVIDAVGEVLSVSSSCPHEESPWSWVCHRFGGERTSVLSNFLFSREAFDRVGGFDEQGFAWGADNELFFRLALESGSIAGVSDVSLMYRATSLNSSSILSAKNKVLGNDWLIKKIEEKIYEVHECEEPFYNKKMVEHILNCSRKKSAKGMLYDLLPGKIFAAIEFLRSRPNLISWEDFVAQFILSLKKLKR